MSADNKKLKACPKITETSVADNKIKLCWTSVPEAEKYGVKRALKPDGEFETLKWVKDTTYTDASVKKDVTYWYKIVASKTLEGKKTSKKSSPVVAEILSDIQSPTEPVAAPSGHNKIELSWKSSGVNHSFVINRRNDFFNQILPVGKVEKTKFTDKDIVSGQVYHYSVQSIIKDEKGLREGNFSKEVSCVYLDCGRIVEIKTGMLGRVFIQVRIVAGADGYILDRSSDGETFKEIDRTESGTALRFADKADKLFGRYYYRTRAYKFIAEKEYISQPSEAVKVKTR